MTTSIDMNNWDVVAAMTFSNVNAAIASADSSPSAISLSNSEGAIALTCGTWQLTPTESSGQNIAMIVPITGGTYTVGSGGTAETLSMPNGQTSIPLNILVTMEYSAANENPDSQNLQVAMGATITDLQASDLPSSISFVARILINTLLQSWFQNNIADEFQHVFAVVDLQAEFAEYPGLAWLQPWHMGYAASVPILGATPNNSVFGVLTLVDDPGNDTARNQLLQNLDFSVDLATIPSGADAGMTVSPQKFLQHFILPACPLMFPPIQNDPPENNFTVDNDNLQVTNINDLSYGNVTLGEQNSGDIVTPSIPAGEFIIEVNQTNLVCTSNNMSYENSPGVYVYMNYTGTNTMSLDAKTGALTLTNVSQTSSGFVKSSEAINIIQIVTGAITIVTSIIAGVGVLYAAATAGTVTATEGAIEMAETIGEDEASATATASEIATSATTVGDTADVSTLGSRMWFWVKVAAGGIGFGTSVTSAGLKIAQEIAKGGAGKDIQISEFTSQALGNTITFQEMDGYEVTSAQLNGALLFGLNSSSNS